MTRYFLPVLVLIVLSDNMARGQPAGEAGFISYSLNLQAGTVLPHHKSLTYFNREYVRSMELNAWFGHPGPTAIQEPVLGAGYFFSGMGNRDIYGHLHAAFVSMLSPPAGRRLPVQLQVGLGIAYATKRFDIESNYFNRAIGSHLNAYGQISLSGKIPVAGDRWTIRPGISFHHISTGAVIAPNQGLNLMTLTAGVEYLSDHRYPRPVLTAADTIPKGRNRFAMIFAPGIKQVDWRVDKHIFTSSLIFDYGYMIRPERSIGMGISFFYNDTWAYIPYIRTEKDDSILPYQSALHISLQMNKGPLAFILHPGIYIYMPAKDESYMTNRLGIKYRFENNLTLQLAIKSHWLAVADYIEWGIGYEFNR